MAEAWAKNKLHERSANPIMLGSIAAASDNIKINCVKVAASFAEWI